MKLYRFSPFTSQESLMECIQYLQEACHELCYKRFGEYLPVSSNVGVFCHYPDEFVYLTKLREALTDNGLHYNNKYFKLHEPIHIAAKNGIPAAIYKYLYIRKPDPYRAQVGDIDFVLEPARHQALAATLDTDEFRNDARMFGRIEENMIELWNPDYDIAAYIVTEGMDRKVKA